MTPVGGVRDHAATRLRWRLMMVTEVEDAWSQLLPHLGHLPPEVAAAAVTLYQQALLVEEGGVH